MTRASKIPRYRQFNEYKNCFGHFGKNPKTWNEYLDDRKDLHLELGAGKSEVTLSLARKYKKNNYIAIDKKSDRLWKAAGYALDEGIANCAFIQDDILELQEFIAPDSVAGIWITFPDPFMKDKQAKHRMLNRNFLDIYKSILNNSGEIDLKTDNSYLFAWTLDFLISQKDIELLVIEDDLHNSAQDDDKKIITTYEQKYINNGQQIYYLRFKFI